MKTDITIRILGIIFQGIVLLNENILG